MAGETSRPRKTSVEKKKNINNNEYSMENNGGDGEEQENMGVMVDQNTTQNIKKQPTNNIHTDDGIIEDLSKKGLVRTIQGPDGASAQVFLTKNGAHAGLVFRDQISRGIAFN